MATGRTVEKQMSLASANIELCSAIVGYIIQYTIVSLLVMYHVC